MTEDQIKMCVRVKTNRDFAGVPKGTEGIIDDDYGTGVMVAWDLPDRPLPRGYTKHRSKNNFGATFPLRDGFDKKTELMFLEVVEDGNNALSR